MNTTNTRNKSKYLVMVGALVASSAIAGVIANKVTLHAPEQFTPTSPTDNFTLTDGTATVEVSQLEWARCLVGQTFTNGECTGEATEFDTWESALAAPTKQQAADGWRVPNIKELVRITETTQAFPAINTEVFPFATKLKFSEQEAQYGGGTFPGSDYSPYIWSSTVVPHDIYKPSPYVPGPKEDDPEGIAAETEKNRNNAELVYALDLAIGDIQKAYRSGESIGQRQRTKYSDPDPNDNKKARYVLLVKDVS